MVRRMLLIAVMCLCDVAWAEAGAGGGPEITLRLDVPAAQHAFVSGKPCVKLTISSQDGQPAWHGHILLRVHDVLSGHVENTNIETDVTTGRPAVVVHDWPAGAGVYHVTAGVVAKEADVPVAETWLAYANGKSAKDLPDDWPLAAHVAKDVPVLPEAGAGGKWYRYFAMWPVINRERDVYHWDEFDRVFAEVKQAGGKLLIASDGSPLWTCARGKVGMDWVKEATAYPPDDAEMIRPYLRAMIERYEDDAGTLGAMELCNEANTPDRWRGTPEQMVELAKVFHEEARRAKHHIDVVGLALSAGDHRSFVESMVKAGLLKHVDVVSAHFYEELQSYQIETPINNLPKHVACVREPMRAAGFDLPMWDTESGIEFAPRENGRLIEQNELNRRAEVDPAFDAKRPWLLGERWRPVSERRAAAEYVSGAVMLMAMNVKRVFCYSTQQFVTDGAPSLPWVAMGQLGHYLDGVDYHHIEALPTKVIGSDGRDGSPMALAYVIGAKGGRRVIVAWAFLSDTSVGRSKHWQRWLDPLAVRIETDVPQGVVRDLYGRSEGRTVRNDGGSLTIDCGEEPVFVILDEPASAKPQAAGER